MPVLRQSGVIGQPSEVEFRPRIRHLSDVSAPPIEIQGRIAYLTNILMLDGRLGPEHVEEVLEIVDAFGGVCLTDELRYLVVCERLDRANE